MQANQGVQKGALFYDYGFKIREGKTGSAFGECLNGLISALVVSFVVIDKRLVDHLIPSGSGIVACEIPVS